MSEVYTLFLLKQVVVMLIVVLGVYRTHNSYMSNDQMPANSVCNMLSYLHEDGYLSAAPAFLLRLGFVADKIFTFI